MQGARPFLLPEHGGWTTIAIRREVGNPSARTTLGSSEAVVRFISGGCVELDRAAGLATIITPQPLGEAHLVHPYLASVGAVFSFWLDRQTYHGGAFVFDDRAWVLLGDKEAGKSSALAWLSTRGHPILADDLTVIDGTEVLTGPRAIDLRSDAAARLGIGEPLGVIGMRERWRVRLPQVEDSHPLGGFVHLAWADRATVRTLGAEQRLRRLAFHRGVRHPDDNPARLLPHTAHPAVELARPRSWEAVPDAMDLLLETLAQTT